MRLEALVPAYDRMVERLRSVLAKHPDATVIRNQVGNLAIINVHDQYIGYIDVLTGEVVVEV